jgi:hypothetical protein
VPGFNHADAVRQCIYALVLVDLWEDILGSWLGKSSVGVVCSAQATGFFILRIILSAGHCAKFFVQ